VLQGVAAPGSALSAHRKGNVVVAVGEHFWRNHGRIRVGVGDDGEMCVVFIGYRSWSDLPLTRMPLHMNSLSQKPVLNSQLSYTADFWLQNFWWPLKTDMTDWLIIIIILDAIYTRFY
jgi:hypothetical protein